MFGSEYKANDITSFINKKKEHELFLSKLTAACDAMHKATKFGNANYIVCSGKFAEEFNKLKNNSCSGQPIYQKKN